MNGFGTREVTETLGLSQAQLYGYVKAGFLRPSRGARGELRFSFQDLLLLRAAQGLLEARIPARRIKLALRGLRAQLPHDRPLTGVRIAAEGERIVVSDGSTTWQPESGQALFDFEVGAFARDVARLPPLPEASGAIEADTWYQRGCALEAAAPGEARRAYRQALALDPAHADARLNLGRLLHEAGDPAAAAEEYRRALTARPEDATAHFNLGVALEDLGRFEEAIPVYQRSVELDPDLADAHYNLGCLLQRRGRATEAVQQLKLYRKLARS
jgi:tetratricopeptide (TPR) repeat protein